GRRPPARRPARSEADVLLRAVAHRQAGEGLGSGRAVHEGLRGRHAGRGRAQEPDRGPPRAWRGCSRGAVRRTDRKSRAAQRRAHALAPGLSAMQIVRTPDERFANLEGWPFAPHYLEVVDADGTPVRIHYVDEGPKSAPPILLMHGNPSWSYLHRKMIGPLAAAGHRVIAVDLVGTGRSDKPALKSDYTLARHHDWMSKWLVGMDLQDITLYCQDWGGTIGLYLVSAHPERFARVVASNTGVPEGRGEGKMMKMWV